MSSSISLSNFSSVSLAAVPTGLAEYDVNNIAIFTNETPNFIEEYKLYKTASPGATDFGSDSLTYKMLTNIFAQPLNPISGGGSVFVIPLQSSVSATQGSFETPNISANIADFKAVTDGAFKISLNGGTAFNVTGLNFSNCLTIADVATIIQRKLTNVFVTVVTGSSAETEQILFTSKKFGTSSAITFSTPDSGTDLTGATYLYTSTGTADTGTASSGETLVEAINRTKSKVYYDGILTTLLIEDSVVKTTASTVQTNEQKFLYPSFSTEDFATAGLANEIRLAGQTKTRLILYPDSIEDGQLAVAAYAGRGHSVNFRGSRTCMTMNLKTLVNVVPSAIVDDSILALADAAGVDTISNCAGLSVVTSSGKNEFFDNVHNDIWLKLALQVAGFNFLQTITTKVPQTAEGMTGLKSAYIQVLEQGVRNGAIGIGLTWNSADTFGSPENLKRNITERGYYIYSIPLSEQSQADRAERNAPLVQIAIKRAGAMHSDAVFGVIEA